MQEPQERALVGELRNLVEHTAAGGDDLPLLATLIVRYRGLHQAIVQCQTAAAAEPSRLPFFQANLEGYHRGVQALEMMDDALEAQDYPRLREGMEAFAAAARQVDQVLQKSS